MQSVTIILKGSPADRAAALAATAAIAAVLPPEARNITAPLSHNPLTGDILHKIHIIARLDTEVAAQALYDAIVAVLPENYRVYHLDWHEDTAADRRAEWQAATAAALAAKAAADVTAMAKVYAELDKAVMDEKAKTDLKAAIEASTGVASQEAAVKP